MAAQAQFTCPNKNDAFTVSDVTKGNGNLSYPVGLITADEIMIAGSGKYGTANRHYYLYRPSNWYWSLSPHYINDGSATMFMLEFDGTLSIHRVNYTGGAVAPVINLNAQYANEMIGSGTMTDPYRASGVTP